MAQLRDTLIQGSARVTDTLYANTLKGNLDLDYVQDAADLKAIEALTGTAGFLKKTAANTWSLDNSTYSKTDTHVNVSLTGAAISHNYLLMTSTAPTSTAAAHTALGATSLWVNSVDKGKFELVLGNSTATSSSGGQYGQLALYSASSAGTYLKSADGTSWTTATLQAKTGTIALTSDITATAVGLGNVENTKLSTWTGSSNIATVGTITSGTWSGTTIAVNKGGTGATTFTADCVIVGNGTSAMASRGLKVTGATDANITLAPNTAGKTMTISSTTGAMTVSTTTAALTISSTTGAMTIGPTGVGALTLKSGSSTVSITSGSTTTINSGSTIYFNKPTSASIIFCSGGADTSHETGRFNINGMFHLGDSGTQNTHRLYVNGASCFNGKVAFGAQASNVITEKLYMQYDTTTDILNFVFV